ncbi:hypothetical protein BH10CHL1_BH10CHL1_26690 [soil metagenome]
MEIAKIQQFLREDQVREDQAQATDPFRSPAEMLVTLTEEMLHLLNLVFVLANHY